MADQEQVELLMQGAATWNAWHREQMWVLRYPDFRDANLSNANLCDANLYHSVLSGANLSNADLRDAHLYESNLSGADLHSSLLCGADLSGSDLSGSDLSGSNLRFAELDDANLISSNLSGADLSYANLCRANLNGADLHGADLHSVDLHEAILDGADLCGAIVSETKFAQIDLRAIKGLAEIVHHRRSYVELHTIKLPQDGSALHFLRGAGVPDEWIDFWRTIMMHPIQYHSCFISYSSKDEVLARRLHADLQSQGVRCWFAPEDLTIGDRFHSRIDEAIHLQDKLLLLLSESAIQSDWVEIEVRAALEKEQRQHRDVLFPVRLDNQVMETSQAWAALLRRSRYIGDFTNWTDPQAYQMAFKRLLDDLKKTDEPQDEEMRQ